MKLLAEISYDGLKASDYLIADTMEEIAFRCYAAVLEAPNGIIALAKNAVVKPLWCDVGVVGDPILVTELIDSVKDRVKEPTNG